MNHSLMSIVVQSLGVDGMLMAKYGIDDIRLFTENDLRFLRQF